MTDKKQGRTGGAVVLFSGGADSTLAAIRMAERAEHVHLLQCHHQFNSKNCLRSLRSVEILERRFGAGRISHRMLNADVFTENYLKRLAELLRKEGTLCISMICGVCKLSMHLLAIRYCRGREIRLACDGSSTHQNYMFPAQTEPVIRYFRDLYRCHGIEFVTPVYDVDRSEEELERLGLHLWGRRNREHLFYSTQPTCFLGLVTYMYTYGFQRPLFGMEARRRSLDTEAVPFLRQIEPILAARLGIPSAAQGE